MRVWDLSYQAIWYCVLPTAIAVRGCMAVLWWRMDGWIPSGWVVEHLLKTMYKLLTITPVHISIRYDVGG
jgi:hypothetical protein